jgi:diguanylate cyclase (GGDEF)-like protein
MKITMKSKSSGGFFYRFFHKPLLMPRLVHSHKITPEENDKVISSLTITKANHAAFLGWFLMLLSLAYMAMFYGLKMEPDDRFFSVIAMFLLFSSSFLYSALTTVAFFLKKENPLGSRIALDAYWLCLMAVMGLYFYAASLNPNGQNTFCPSFLYLLIFAFIASPYLLDSLVPMVGGLVVVLVISGLGGTGVVTLLQYGFIGAIFLSAMVYLASFNYLSQIKTIRLNKANDELAFLSTHDPLTGVNNRHSLHTYLAANRPLLLSKKSQVAFIMMDIDCFKNYNDHLSHMEGDECLKKVVNSITSAQLFSKDYFYRFGGDEFLIVIPNATKEEVKRIGIGIVKAVYSAKMRSAPNSQFPYVSISAGASLCSMVPEKNLDDYLAEADKELYLAKNGGRNRFYFLGKEIK